MANRSTLHVDRLEDFKAWLVEDGWDLEDPKGDYEVLRARKPDRKRPLILWRRLSNSGGGELTHLTYDDRDSGVIRAFLADMKNPYGKFTVEDLVMLVMRTGAEITLKPRDPPGGSRLRFTVRLTKWLRPAHGDLFPWAMEADVEPRPDIGASGTLKYTLEMLEHELDAAMKSRYHEEAERRNRTQ